jgi:oxygen-independent coproporphyrinogen III oxidase
MDEMVHAIIWEIGERKSYLNSQKIETIYFGGGTPSLLNNHQLSSIIDTIAKNFQWNVKELTLEVNPDDISSQNLENWKAMGIDRLSIGIQSFHDEILQFYNRAHNAYEAKNSIHLARKAGFEKLSIDLIYGFPHLDHQLWKNDLEEALKFDPGHISSYCLTVEPKTALGNWHKKGIFKEASEEFAAEQFEMLQDKTEQASYIQYEISNFAKENQFAIHNSNYWKGIPYLGIGPGAHSFDGQHRGQNPPNNSLFLNNFRAQQLAFEIESLSQEDVINEYILTSLRTIWGTDLKKMDTFGITHYFEQKENHIQQLQKEGLLTIQEHHLILTKKGKLLADSIASSLFV